MYYLIYSSQTKKDLRKDELFSILEKSRVRNKLMGISGFLLCINEDYHPDVLNGMFLQVLEGEKEDVVKLYNIIKDDTRHREAVVIAEGVLFNRMFDNWRMGFRDLNILQFKSVLAQFDLNRDDLTKPLSSDENSEAVLEFIQAFYKVPSNLMRS